MEEYIWTYGEKPEKSYKKDIEPLIITPVDLNINMNVGEFRASSNKREIANNKLNDRELIGQVNQSPFHTTNNYLRDLDVQQNFLMPKSSNNTDM